MKPICLLTLISYLLPFLSFAKQPPPANQIDTYNIQAQKILARYPDSAFVLANQALRMSEANGYLSGAANSQQLLGKIFYHQGIFTQSLENLLAAEKYFESNKATADLASNYYQLGKVYYDIRQPEKAMFYQHKALSVYEELDDNSGLADTYGAIGRLYEKNNDYDSAIIFQQKALKIYEQENDLGGKARILENIGSIYEDKEQFDEAEAFFMQSFRLTEMLGDTLLMVVNLNNLGDIYRKTGDLPEALQYTRTALAISERINNPYQTSGAHKDMAKTYELLGKFDSAYWHMDLAQQVYKTMYTQETALQLGQIQTLYEVERKDFEIFKLENRHRHNRLIKFSMGGGFIFLTMLGFLVTNRQKLKIRKKQEAIEHNQRVYLAEKKLMESKIEYNRLGEEKLEQEIQNSRKSLTAHTLHIIGKNKMLDEIRSKLQQLLDEEPKHQRRHLKHLIKSIDLNFTQDKDWDDFKHIFKQVHQEFFEQLAKICPELSAADLRLAALLKMNMQSKDIYTILGIAPNSLRISKYRLKKKLKLDAKENLQQFILSI